jgi:murein DD-endopeptidase MepM/ murein hydrolase activator NlpD
MLQPPDNQIPVPLPTVRTSQIRDTWHARRSERRRHEGQDIFAPVGTPIYSATYGIVIRIGYAGKGGNAVSVLGPGGRTYYYAHLAGFAESLRVGTDVTPETVLGYVGRTGNARTTPSHLHFGVYDFAGAINPFPLLTNRSQRFETGLSTPSPGPELTLNASHHHRHPRRHLRT